MKRIVFSLAALLSLAYSSQATCTYQKVLDGQEFPIGIMLTWSTSLEENTSTFMIEKSENGLDFVNIGTTPSVGNSKKVKEYNFLDVMATTPFVHYRLKQIDVDGSFSFTDVLKVKKTITNNFMIARMSSPNTAKDFMATVDVFKEGDLRYEVRDLENNVLFSSIMPVQAGLNEVSVSLIDLAPNVYKFYLVMDKEEESVVLQKTLDEVEKAKIPVANGQIGTNGKH
jgi:hypothetical protein